MNRLFSAQNTVSDFKHVFSIMKPRFMLVDPGVVERVLEALGDSRTVIMILGEEEGEKYPSFRRVRSLLLLLLPDMIQ